MFKPFISPLVISWNKLLKGYKIPANLRNTLLILFAAGITQLTMFGAMVVALIAILTTLR